MAMQASNAMLQEPATDLEWDKVLSGLTAQLKRRVCAKREYPMPMVMHAQFCWHDAKTGFVCPYDLQAFLQRVHKYSLASPQAYITALCFIDVLLEKQAAAGLYLDESNVHVLALLAIMIATKFVDDKYVSNKRCAEIGGQALERLNTMEESFLNLTQYTLHIKPEVYAEYQQQVMMRDTVSNGWQFNSKSFVKSQRPCAAQAGRPQPVAACAGSTTPALVDRGDNAAMEVGE
jgi:hypothetical protein